MAKIPVINSGAKLNNDTGFGSNPHDVGGRFINRDGTFNVVKRGLRLRDRFSRFNAMLNLSPLQFFLCIFLIYLGVNVLFAFAYFAVGPQEFDGLKSTTAWGQLRKFFYFSAQTFTTVGYGRINPTGDLASFISSFEAMLGFISFAVVTGFIYARFARPRAFLSFSNEAIIAPYLGGHALMFRFAGIKDDHVLTNVNVKVNCALSVNEGGVPVYKFFDLALERNHVDSLPMNWTVVHPIDEASPLNGFTEEDMKAADVEIYVLVNGFDDVYSAYVLQRTSYVFNEIRFNRKFVQMYHESDDRKTTVVEVEKLSDHVPV